MNEEELKNIWKRNDKETGLNFNFKEIESSLNLSRAKLRRKIKLDIFLNILIYILFAPVFYYFPKSVFLLPMLIAVFAWYLLKITKIYKFEKDFANLSNAKELLIEKQKLLETYFRHSRYFTYIGIPFIFTYTYIVLTSFDSIYKHPLNFITVIFISYVLGAIIIEVWIRHYYGAPMDEIKDLLQQLDEN